MPFQWKGEVSVHKISVFKYARIGTEFSQVSQTCTSGLTGPNKKRFRDSEGQDGCRLQETVVVQNVDRTCCKANQDMLFSLTHFHHVPVLDSLVGKRAFFNAVGDNTPIVSMLARKALPLRVDG